MLGQWWDQLSTCSCAKVAPGQKVLSEDYHQSLFSVPSDLQIFLHFLQKASFTFHPVCSLGTTLAPATSIFPFLCTLPSLWKATIPHLYSIEAAFYLILLPVPPRSSHCPPPFPCVTGRTEVILLAHCLLFPTSLPHQQVYPSFHFSSSLTLLFL